MPKAISSFRHARSFIGGAATEESVELDFNIGTREAIEIVSVAGTIALSAITEAASITSVQSEQTLHLEDGTIEALSSIDSEADQFENDSEVIFQQVLNSIAFNGTTEGGVTIDGSHHFVKYARPILSPINPTHRVDNRGDLNQAGYTLLIEYRYVELSDRELALEFARRRR